MPRDAVSRTSNVGTVGKNGLTNDLFNLLTYKYSIRIQKNVKQANIMVIQNKVNFQTKT